MKKNSKKLESKITSQIKNEFSFDVPIIILSNEKLQDIVEQNPFVNGHNKDESFLHVTFLADEVTDYDEVKLSSKIQEGKSITLLQMSFIYTVHLVIQVQN